MINSRAKGHGFERKIAETFRRIGWAKAERKLEYQFSQATGVDLKNTEPFLIQCKSKREYVPLNTILEIQGQGIPLLITKGDRKHPIAALYLHDLLPILESWKQDAQRVNAEK